MPNTIMPNTIMPNTKEKEEKCEMSTTQYVFFILGIIFPILVFIIFFGWLIMLQYFSIDIHILRLPPKNPLQKA